MQSHWPPPYRGAWALRAQNPKNHKEVSLGLRPRDPKKSKSKSESRVRKRQKPTQRSQGEDSFDSFRVLTWAIGSSDSLWAFLLFRACRNQGLLCGVRGTPRQGAKVCTIHNGKVNNVHTLSPERRQLGTSYVATTYENHGNLPRAPYSQIPRDSARETRGPMAQKILEKGQKQKL